MSETTVETKRVLIFLGIVLGSILLCVGLLVGATKLTSSQDADSKLHSTSLMVETKPTRSEAANAASNHVPGVTASAINWGFVGPFKGPNKDGGRGLKVGIEMAFSACGTVNGRQIRLVSKDDEYDANKTKAAVRALIDSTPEHPEGKVFGFIGNYGTATGLMALGELNGGMVFFAPYTGGLRKDPTDKNTFHLGASYEEETAAAVRFLTTIRGIPMDQIAVFAQHDAFGRAGAEGVARAYHNRWNSFSHEMKDRMPEAPVFTYERNSEDVSAAIAGIQAIHGPIRAIVMIATYQAAAAFIKAAHNRWPGMLFTNVSYVGASALQEELKTKCPTCIASSIASSNIIVTQSLPDPDGRSAVALQYKSLLPSEESPNRYSFYGYIAGTLLCKGLKEADPDITPTSLIAAFEATHVDLGLGVLTGFTGMDHQAIHRIWGTALGPTGYEEIELQ